MAKKKSKAKKQDGDAVEAMRDSARKVWLAGLGALAAAEAEGSKLFNSLVDKGEEFEGRTAPHVQKATAKVKGKASDSWEKIEQTVESKVTAALDKMGLTRAEEVAALREELAALHAKLDAVAAKRTRKKAARKTVRKPAAKKAAAKKTTARKPAAKRTTRKPAAKKTARKPAARKAAKKTGG